MCESYRIPYCACSKELLEIVLLLPDCWELKKKIKIKSNKTAKPSCNLFHILWWIIVGAEYRAYIIKLVLKLMVFSSLYEMINYIFPLFLVIFSNQKLMWNYYLNSRICHQQDQLLFWDRKRNVHYLNNSFCFVILNGWGKEKVDAKSATYIE